MVAPTCWPSPRTSSFPKGSSIEASGQSIQLQWNCEGMRKAYQGLGGVGGSCSFRASSGVARRRSSFATPIVGTSHWPRKIPHGLNRPTASPVLREAMACPGQPVLRKFSAFTARSGRKSIGPKLPSTFIACETVCESNLLKSGPATQSASALGGLRATKKIAAAITIANPHAM